MDLPSYGQDARPRLALGALALLAVLALPTAPASAAGALPALEEVRSVPTADLGLTRPTGMAFSAGDGTLLVAEGRKVRRMTLLERRVAARASAADRRRVRPRTALDSVRGVRYVLARDAASIRRVGPRGGVSRISLHALRGMGVTGIGVDAADGLVYAVARTSLFALDRRGRIRHTSTLPARLADPRAVVFARSADPTDTPGTRHVYVLDRGDGRRLGRIVELGRARPAASIAATPTTIKGTLVQLIATSAFGPPSPDPSGVTYLPGPDRLMIADSEVEEMSIYQGKNLFTSSRTGSGAGYGTTTAFSKEPTGLGFNPADGTLFVSDDDKDRIFVLRAGPDGLYSTADDIRTAMVTTAFGSNDPEDIEYDQSTGHLFVCDGTGLEIYDVDPVDGVFANGNDSVTHFDTGQYAARDCEGLGIDQARGTLLAVDPSRKNILELTRTGGLVRKIDLSTLPVSNKAYADVVMAPTSSTSDDPAAQDYWIVDRQIDNGSDDKENDGKLYEVTAGAPSTPPPPPNAPPTVSLTAPAPGTVVSGTVTISANASDDVGVTQVAFFVDGAQVGVDTNGADGWSVAWNTATVANGARTLTARASDGSGNTTTSGTVGVTVDNGTVSVTKSFPVAIGNDDGDEIPDGTVRRTNGDFELGHEQLGLATTAAARYAGVTIPSGAIIEHAHLQFTVDESNRAAASFVLTAEASDNAAAFTSGAFNMSGRPRTAASVSWAPPVWLTEGAAGVDQQTPELNAMLQEVVNRPGWASGNALVILASGDGRRTAESFEGGAAPVLHVKYVLP